MVATAWKRVSLSIAWIAGPALFFFAVLPLIFTIGPWAETKYFPVIEQQGVDLSYLPPVSPEYPSARLQFYLEGQKLRPCRLETSQASWWINGQGGSLIVPTLIVNTEGKTFSGVLTVASGPYRIGPYTTPIPSQVLDSAEPVELRITLYHRCHPLWLSETLVRIPVNGHARLGGKVLGWPEWASGGSTALRSLGGVSKVPAALGPIRAAKVD